MMKPSGHTSVMASRIDPRDSLDYFPTPPWATRALIRYVLDANALKTQTVWEPAAGSGHMAEVLGEVFAHVRASDVHDYGYGYEVGSFVGEGEDVAPTLPVDWIITNPPFTLACDFAQRAVEAAKVGVALLVRTSWLESAERYELFDMFQPHTVALHAGRVAMVKGRWNPKASTATSYCWVIWRNDINTIDTRLTWIPPHARMQCARYMDEHHFANRGVINAD